MCRSSVGWSTLDADEVHLWCVALSLGDRAASGESGVTGRFADRLETCVALLSVDERARMERLRFAAHQHRFALRRAALRTILAGYLGVEERAVVFQYSAHGKPELANSPLRFNLSDSEDFALIGVTWGAAIGVDVERIRPFAERDAIARSHFSAREHRAYLQTPAETRERAFYNCWTRKEAWLKARGEGLIAGLQGFDVTLGSAARLLGARGETDVARRWRVYSRLLLVEFVAAVAVERASNKLSWRRFRWTGTGTRS